MDIITYALDMVKNTIPVKILKLAYDDRVDWRKTAISLDEQILRKTIRGRVKIDVDISGGETIIINLNGLNPIQLDKYNYIFEIPGERVNFRTILSCLSVNYMAFNSVTPNQLSGIATPQSNMINDVLSAAHRAMDSRSNIPIVSNAECLVVGHNTIMVRNHIITASVVQARLVVTNDENLNNIPIRSAPFFGQLCVWAVKSFIYKELLVAIEQGYLERGQELGVIKNYVDNLSDAEENYQTYKREVWDAVGVMSNRMDYEDLMRIQMEPL